MKKNLLIGFSILLLAFIAACNNPFFPEKKENGSSHFSSGNGLDLVGITDLEAGVDIGSIKEGEEAKPFEVTIENNSDKPTGDLTITISGDDADKFTIEPDELDSIDPGDSDSFTITPKDDLEEGTYTAIITIKGDDDLEIEFEITFTVGPAPDPNDGIDLDIPNIEAGVDIGSITEGEDAEPFEVTIENNSDKPTGDLTITVSGDDADKFTIEPDTLDSIDPGDSDSFTIIPDPGLEEGTYTATITIESEEGIKIEFEITFTVNPKPAVNIDETPQVFTYNGSAKSFVITGTPDTSFDITYNQGGGNVIPINAGSYNVVITRTKDSEYAAFSKTIINGLVIDKINSTVNWPINIRTASWQQMLGDVKLPNNGSGTPGVFAWVNPATAIVTEASYLIRFTPNDTVNYNTAEEAVTVIYNYDIKSISGIEMVWIPAGSFSMGQSDIVIATPVREVTLTKGFYMGIYPVTQAQYEAVMLINPSNFKTPVSPETSTANRPVEQVTWFDAIVFCNRLSELEGLEPVYTLTNVTVNIFDGITYIRSATVAVDWEKNGYRLPTEAQWEYACRAGTTTAYNTGDSINTSQANFNSNRTSEVGSYAHNAWGLYDMYGNVGEMCWDWRETYDANDLEDPQGAAAGTGRVVRGGSFYSSAAGMQSASRSSISPNNSSVLVGFRVVRP